MPAFNLTLRRSLAIGTSAAAVVVMLACGNARAAVSNDTFKAEALYAACNGILPPGSTQADREEAETICAVYFRGLTDGLYVMQSLASKGWRICMPPDQPISVPEARAFFEKWLRQHPEAWQNATALVASMPLVTSYECR
jgi:hypothetical protein